jgi:thiol-disulfide isomerase/thioredoxin
MKKLFLLTLLFSLAACGGGPPAERPKLAKAGLPAPELSLKKIINAPAAVKEINGWSELEGKAVVLEFWATWCDPCVESIPHMNQLAERFSGKPVVFISVTDESEADVRAFLKDHRMDSWIAPEAGAGLFKAFRVYGRPHTVLINRDGKVAAFTYPAKVTEETVMALLAGKTPAAAAQDGGPEGAQAEPLAEFYIGRSRHAAQVRALVPARRRRPVRDKAGRGSGDGRRLRYPPQRSSRTRRHEARVLS